MNVLVVEDERTDFMLVEHAITRLNGGYRVLHAQGCDEAVRLVRTEAPIGLALVDILLPDGSGYLIADHLKRLRIPYVMVSSKSLAENAVQGLRHGAEDYIRKPFDVEELTARLECVLRRTRTEPPPQPLPFNAEELLPDGDRHVDLTPIERHLLELLHAHYDTYVSSEKLIDTIWGPTGQERSKGALRTYISHIRKKLSRAKSPLAIVSKWGRGYRLTALGVPRT